MRRGTQLIAAAMSALALTFASVSAATAAPQPSSSTVVQSCATAIRKALKSKADQATIERECTVTTSMALGAEEVANADMLAADPDLTVTDRQQIAQTISLGGGVYSKSYSQFVTGAAYTVTHGGRFYYNGSKVWVGTTYLGYRGSHVCYVNYAVGVSIATNSCSESGSTTTRSMYYGYTVTLFTNGFPAAYGYGTTATLRSNGTASGFGVTTG